MSLFSFQDIITTTTGILILLVLVLALSVIIQGAESEIESDVASEDTVAIRDSLSEEVDRLNQLVDELKSASSIWSSLTPRELESKVSTAKAKRDRLTKEIEDHENSLSDEKKSFQELESETQLRELQDRISQEEDSIQEAAKRLKEIKATDRVVYNFRNNSRQPWLVQIAADTIVASKIQTKEAPQQFRTSFEFNKFAVNLPKTEQYFVLILKPSGIGNYDTISSYLRQNKCDIGVELIGENQTAVDPLKGAGFETP
jgi:hypothetical protein